MICRTWLGTRNNVNVPISDPRRMRTLLARDAEDVCDPVSSSDSPMARLLAETERVSRRDRGGLGKISIDDSSSELLGPSSSANTSSVRNHEKHRSMGQ